MYFQKQKAVNTEGRIIEVKELSKPSVQLLAILTTVQAILGKFTGSSEFK